MSGPVKNRVGTNVRGNECPGFMLIDLICPGLVCYLLKKLKLCKT